MKFRAMVVVIALSCLLAACADRSETLNVKKLRVSVLPDQSEERLRQRYTPLLRFLSAETGIELSLIPANDYADLLERFERGEIDIARFGGFTFVKAQVDKRAVPLVMRDVDARFESVFIVRGDSTAGSLEEFKGKAFAFGSELSTSGHLMPRYFLGERNINPEQFFSRVVYSGAHDRTVEWVRTGKVDLGVANALVVTSHFERGDIGPTDIRILWTTPPYADYVWAARAEIPETTRKKLIAAFLKLSKFDPEQANILEQLGADVFLPATTNDFSALKLVGHQLQLLQD